MDSCPIHEVGLDKFEQIVEIVGGKWKLRILFVLASAPALRYSAIKKQIPSISHKMLSAQLKELEADGLVHRQDYAEIPPRVEYSMTEKGLALKPVMQQLCRWMQQYHH